MKFEDKINISNHLNEYDFKKLKIKFLDKDEIKIFSTICQDGIFSIDEIIYNKSEKILIATFSRFCWEFLGKKIKDETCFSNSLFYNRNICICDQLLPFHS